MNARRKSDVGASALRTRFLAILGQLAIVAVMIRPGIALGQFEKGEVSPRKTLTPREIYVQTLNSIAFITTDSGSGTGWVWDIERKLVVTNDHVVAGAKEIELYFPVHQDGVLQVETEFYRDEATPVKGKVIDSDQKHDLALIQLESLPDTARPIRLADRSAAPGERVHAIGGLPRGSEGLWKYSTGYVSQVANADISQTGNEVMALQSNIDINSGNSGGPLVNDEGCVVGVAQSYRTDARAVSYSVDVSTVRDYLEEVCPLVDSDSAEAKVALGRRHRLRGRYEEAMKVLTEALDKDDESAEAHTVRGYTFIDMGDYVTAVGDFSAAIEIDSSDTEAWRGRSYAYRNLEEFDKSLSDISRAIMNDTSNAGLYNERAIVQEKREEFNLALGDYRRALDLDPNNARFLGNRADLFLNIERYGEAADDLKKALELVPGSGWLDHMMGLAYYRSKDYQSADAYFRKAVEIDDTNVRYIADWGENVQALENHDLGIKLWSRAIELDNEYPYAYYSRAWSLRRIGKLNAALNDMNRAISMAGDNTPAYYYIERGKVFEDMGKSTEARQDFDTAAKIDPENYGGNSNANGGNNSPVVGRWYVNQNINGARFEMSHEYGPNGTYNGVAHYTSNGQTETTEEQGKYAVRTDVIRFNTNLGQYDQRYRLQDDKFWLYFDDMNVWVGSVRK